MTPDAAKAMYRRRIGVGKTILVRRYTGAGPNRPKYDVPVRARVMGYMPHQLIGGIQQGDRKVILLAEDLDAAGFAGPITTNDRIVVDNDPEMKIIAPDKATRECQGVLIAYELQVRGQ